MYYSYIEIEYVATSFSPARTDLALKLLRGIWDFEWTKKPELVLFGRYVPWWEQNPCAFCSLTCIGTGRDTVVSDVRWLVVGCTLAFSLAARNSRSELIKVEKRPSTQPINAMSFDEG
jgi:hypothetical protein